MPEYSRNHAYTWQRITSWVLVIGIIAHVIHMRFIERPISAEQGSQNYYMVKVNLDSGIYTLADRLNVGLYDAKRIQEAEKIFLNRPIFETTHLTILFSCKISSKARRH